MGTTKVLVVDDDQGSRELLSEVLAANGYVVAAVANGSAACDELSRDGGYEIVIADLRMPNGSGLDLLRELRDGKGTQDLILMSSFMTGPEKRQALDLGAKALLEKPFKLTELLSVVGNLAEQRSIGIKVS
ncbi:MAG TPA: response regulator [Terriglobia bacterium]|nr:response regulator [Terriglobia bacterium]